MLDYKLLEALASVFDAGSFEQAAKQLHLTQSAISQRVKLLEARCGQPLLVRSNPVQATPKGQQLLKHYRKVSLLEAMSAVDAVAPALEIIDSRYANFKFSLADVVADNSSSSGFVLGQWCCPKLDISNQAMVMEINGKPVQIGSSSAILGNPWRSLVEAARLAAESDICLEAGWIVLAGAATAAHPLNAADHVCLHTSSMGQVHLQAGE